MKLEKFKEIGITIKKYNSLEHKLRLEIMRPYFVNPFDTDRKFSGINPFTFKLFGEWEDGVYVLLEPFNCLIKQKVEVLDNKVIKAYEFNQETGRFRKVEIPQQADT